jgi:DNA-binding transcriptional ArsR family regulator
MHARSRHLLPGVVHKHKVASARRGLPAVEVTQHAVEVFKALANPVRLSVMHALSHDEMSVGDLARALDLSLSATSHQLAVLRRLRLIAARDEGRLTFYRTTDALVSHLVHDCLVHVGETLGMPNSGHHHRHRAGRPPKRPRTRSRK